MILPAFFLGCDFDPTPDGIYTSGSGGLIALNLCCYAEFAAVTLSFSLFKFASLLVFVSCVIRRQLVKRRRMWWGRTQI